jgi:hypothetical protein
MIQVVSMRDNLVATGGNMLTADLAFTVIARIVPVDNELIDTTTLRTVA